MGAQHVRALAAQQPGRACTLREAASAGSIDVLLPVQPTCHCLSATFSHAAPNIMNFKFGREVSRGMGGRKGGHKLTQHAGWTACGGGPRGRTALHPAACCKQCCLSPPTRRLLPCSPLLVPSKFVVVYAVEPMKALPRTPWPAGARRAAPPVLHRAAGPLWQHGEGQLSGCDQNW